MSPTTEQLEQARDRLLGDDEYYARNCLSIIDQGGRLVALDPKPAQQRFLAIKATQEAERKPVRIIVLKARREGISTSVQGCMVKRVTQRRNHKALVLAHDKKTASEIFAIGETMYGNLPDEEIAGLQIKPPTASARRGQEIRLGQPSRERRLMGDTGLNSSYFVDTANEYEAGRGFTYHSLHLCLAPETPILLEDGAVKPVNEVAVGSKVLTHTGASTRISCITAREPSEANGGGQSVIVTPWLGSPIELTPNHPVWVKTRRSDAKRSGRWRRADELTTRDWVAMPVRPITNDLLSVTLPKVRYRHGSKMGATGSETLVELGEEFGFAVGYYLAEGSLSRNHGKPSGLVFSRHRDEIAYADRAVAALDGLCGKRNTRDRVGTLTTAEEISCSPLARFLEAEFGHSDQKRVPDWVFEAGREFCQGLLAGYLSGDGSKQDGQQGPHRLSSITATTICSSIATQIRDLAASLGYGWGRTVPREGGMLYGRNCRPAWVTNWNGESARKLRGLVGLDVAQNGRKRSEKTLVEDGMVWMKVRKLEEGQVSLVYDVEVDHPDHSFRTLSFAVKNSEMAFYQSPEKKLMAILSTVANEPETFITIESTANGYNLFRRLWVAAVSGNSDFYPLFIPWYEEPDYTIAFANQDDREEFIRSIGQGEYGEDEPALVELGVTPEQLQWRRWAIINRCHGDLRAFWQEFPASWEEAFLSTGRQVFAPSLVAKVIDRTGRTDPTAQKGVLKPQEWEDATYMGRDIQIPRKPLWVPEKAADVGIATPMWRRWEMPDIGDERTNPPRPPGQYIVVVDSSSGRDTATEGTDYFAIEVINHRTLEQVAEYHARGIDADVVAQQAFLIAQLYGPEYLPWLAVEITGGYGVSIANKLYRYYRYAMLYFRRPAEQKKEKAEQRLGWSTDVKTKPLIVDHMKELLRTGHDGVRSKGLAGEMQTFVKDEKGKMGAEEDYFDDRLDAYMVAQYIASEKPMRRSRKISTAPRRRVAAPSLGVRPRSYAR